MRRKAGVGHWRRGATVPRSKVGSKGQGSTLPLVRCTTVSYRVVAHQPRSRAAPGLLDGYEPSLFSGCGANGNATRIRTCTLRQKGWAELLRQNTLGFRSWLTHQVWTALVWGPLRRGITEGASQLSSTLNLPHALVHLPALRQASAEGVVWKKHAPPGR